MKLEMMKTEEDAEYQWDMTSSGVFKPEIATDI